MNRIVFAVATLFALLALSASASAAETVDLGYSQHTGPNPSVGFAPESVDRPLSFALTYSADPIQPLEIEYHVSCRRGSESVADEHEETITPPLSLTVPVTMTNPDSCWISAYAYTPCCDEVPGTLRIEGTAQREPPPPPPEPVPAPAPAPQPETPLPYWQRCTRPHWTGRGALVVHGDRLSCRAGRRIARIAWWRRRREGKLVHVGRYRCLREQRGRWAVVRCSRGSERLRLTGRLRAARRG